MLRSPNPIKVLSVKTIRTDSDMDVEMEQDDAPGVPPSSPYVDDPPPPFSANETNGPVLEKTPANDNPRLEGLKYWVEGLEKTVDSSIRELREKICALEHELLVEVADLADLRWTMVGVEDEVEKGKTEGQRRKIATLDRKAAIKNKLGRKRDERRGKGRTPHKYWTRYAAAQGDFHVEVRKKDMEAVEERIGALEAKVEAQQKEMSRLRAELHKVEALEEKIAELSAEYKNFRANQQRLNAANFQDALRLRTHVQSVVNPCLNAHARDLALLNARYQAIFNAAVNIFGYETVADHLVAAQKMATPAFPPLDVPRAHSAPRTNPDRIFATRPMVPPTSAPQIPRTVRTVAV